MGRRETGRGAKEGEEKTKREEGTGAGNRSGRRG